MSAARNTFYVTFGTLAGSAPSYVVRAADNVLFEALDNGEYCYVLSSRQMGKSSLMIRTLRRLKAAGGAVAVLDLTMLGFNVTAEQWYNSLLEQLGSRLNVQSEAEAYASEHANISPLQRWLGMIRQVLLTHIESRIVIFIDEIDLVRNLPFSTDEFFAAIRACYNARAEDDAYGRLTFCLLGVATPSDLIGDARLTPFNIGRRIHLEDFTASEAAVLQSGLGPDQAANEKTMARILHWTNGHPCLTQRLCKAVVEGTGARTAAAVDASCARLFPASQGELTEDNLAFVSQRLLDDTEHERTELLVLYDRVLAGKPVSDDETRPLVARLKLSGVVKAERERLVVRNRIYVHVFNRAWVQKHLPGAELQRQRAAFLRGVLRTAVISAAVLILVTSLAITAVHEAKQANRYAQIARSEATRTLDLLYASDMNLMQTAYERNDFRHMRNLLAETANNPNCGFEWFYWHRKLNVGVVTLNYHNGPLWLAEFSPGGPQIILFGKDNVVRLWDTLTGRELPALPHPGHIYWAGVSVDGRQIISYTTDCVRLWDIATGLCLNTMKTRGTKKPVSDARLEARQNIRLMRQPAPIYVDGVLGKWIVDRQFDISKVSADTTLDDTLNLIVYGNNAVRVWNNKTHRPLGTLAHRDTLYTAAFSPDNRCVVTCSRDGTAKVWDTETQQLLFTLVGHRGAVRMAAFSPDSRRIVTVGDDRLGIVWDAATGKRLVTLEGSESGLMWVRYSPDGKLIATADQEGTLKLWSTIKQSDILLLAASRQALDSAIYSHSGKCLITCGDDGIARVWDAASGRVMYSLMGHKGSVNAVSYSLDDHKILTAGDDGTVRVWDAVVGSPLLTLAEPGSKVFAAALSPDGRRIAMGLDNHAVKIRDALTGVVLYTLNSHTDRISSIAFSPDGRLIATAGADRTTRLWEAATGKPLHTLKGHTGNVYTVAFSSDGRRLITGSRDRTARIWDVRTGRALLTIEGQDAPIYSAVFSPDGNRILTGGGPAAKLWDAGNGRQLLELHADKKDVFSAAFSPDGRQIVTAGADGTARIWSAEPTGP